MNNYKEIKMNYKKETKRCIMPKNYTEFKQMISKCYGITEKEINNFLISYTDDEDDKVLITSDFDFEQAIIFMEKQKICILRINVDIQDNNENFELIDKSIKFSENMNNSLEKSFKSNTIIEETKESPKDFNKTISSIDRKSERNVNKMNEICNKIERMNILDKIDNISIIGTESKEIIKEKSGLNNFENILSKLSENQITPLIIKPIRNKPKKKEKRSEIKPIFSFSSKKEIQEISSDNKIKKFGEKLKHNLDKMLDKKFSKLKEKITQKTMEKSMKLMEKFMAKKKNSPKDLEDLIQQKKDNLAIHSNVSCDDCRVSPIQGNRYKCAVCHNFDFCSGCEEKNKDSHPHPFILIRNPDRAPHSISCIVTENCSIIQKNIPCNQEYKLADAIIKNSIIVEGSQLSSQCLTNNLEIIASVDSKDLIKTLKLKNNGLKSWPKPVYLTCISESSTLLGIAIPIKIKVEPGKETNVEIKVCIKDLNAGEYVSVWQLQNEKKEFFGDRIVVNIKVESKLVQLKSTFNQYPKELFKPDSTKQIILNSNSNNIVSSQRPKEEIYDSFVYQFQVDELKTAFNLRNFDDKTIKKAAVEAKGDVDKTLQLLINKEQKK